MKIEINGTLKNVTIKDKAVAQFEISDFEKIPQLVPSVSQSVILTIESPQDELPLDDTPEMFDDDFLEA